MGTTDYTPAWIGLLGVVIGAAVTIGVEMWREVQKTNRARKGAENLLIGLLRDCSIYAYVGAQAVAPIAIDSLKAWQERNSLLIATLASPDIMASVSSTESASLWNAANQGTVAVGMLLNMSQPGNTQGKYAPNVSTSALNHYTKARISLDDSESAESIMKEMTNVSRGG